MSIIQFVPVYLTLQRMGCAARHIAKASGGLLPRLFTLTLRLLLRRLFSVTLPDCCQPLPVRKHVALVARTFLPPLLVLTSWRATEWPTLLYPVTSNDSFSFRSAKLHLFRQKTCPHVLIDIKKMVCRDSAHHHDALFRSYYLRESCSFRAASASRSPKVVFSMVDAGAAAASSDLR